MRKHYVTPRIRASVILVAVVRWLDRGVMLSVRSGYSCPNQAYKNERAYDRENDCECSTHVRYRTHLREPLGQVQAHSYDNTPRLVCGIANHPQ